MTDDRQSAPEDASTVLRDVEVRTADGVCDAVLCHPDGAGSWPGVIIWTDIVGLRPVFRDMARRLAAEGYTVLVHNPFYRWKRAPVAGDATNLLDPEVRGMLFGLAAQITNDGVARDSQAFVDFLDAQPQTDKTRKIGIDGYCMGGRLVFINAAATPSRVGAVASFHGFGLVTLDADSPHKHIARSEAKFLVAIAQNDDAGQPDAKDVLRQTFADTGHPADVEVYAADHGWCVKGTSVYDEAASERAWAALVAFFKSALV